MRNEDGNGYHRIISNFVQVAARFKDGSFAEEQEWRLISPVVALPHSRVNVRPTGTGLVPYFEFDLKTGKQPLKTDIQPWRTNEDICVRSVIIGPNPEFSLQMNALGKLFDAKNAYVNVVSRSDIPFRVL